MASRCTIRILLLLVLLTVAGCETMGPTEYGVRFRKLPPGLFGGVASKAIPPGKTIIVIPAIDSIYRFTTSVQDISWGQRAGGEGGQVYTRANDGNEVALSMTILFQVDPREESLSRLVQEVASTDEEVRELVGSVALAEVRTAMNELRTSDFLDKDARYRAVDLVRSEIQKRLDGYGITIVRVNLDDFRFERLVQDGDSETVDSSYQDKLREIQRLGENREREKQRVKTVQAKKQQEINEMQAQVNRWIQEAEGYKNQAALRGDGYLKARRNEAAAVLAQGRAIADGLRAQIQALSGPGGVAVLKLELARKLAEAQSKFVVMGENARAIDVQRTDTNQLIDQIGLIEGMKDRTSSGASAEIVGRPTAEPPPLSAPSKSETVKEKE